MNMESTWQPGDGGNRRETEPKTARSGWEDASRAAWSRQPERGSTLLPQADNLTIANGLTIDLSENKQLIYLNADAQYADEPNTLGFLRSENGFQMRQSDIDRYQFEVRRNDNGTISYYSDLLTMRVMTHPQLGLVQIRTPINQGQDIRTWNREL